MLSKLEILDTISNTVLLTGTKAAMSGEDYTYAFDLSAIPEGKYDLTFRATDTFNSSQLPFRSLIIDNSLLQFHFRMKGNHCYQKVQSMD